MCACEGGGAVAAAAPLPPQSSSRAVSRRAGRPSAKVVKDSSRVKSESWKFWNRSSFGLPSKHACMAGGMHDCARPSRPPAGLAWLPFPCCRHSAPRTRMPQCHAHTLQSSTCIRPLLQLNAPFLPPHAPSAAATHRRQCRAAWAASCTGASGHPQSLGERPGQSGISGREYQSRRCHPAHSPQRHRRLSGCWRGLQARVPAPY